MAPDSDVINVNRVLADDCTMSLVHQVRPTMGSIFAVSRKYNLLQACPNPADFHLGELRNVVATGTNFSAYRGRREFVRRGKVTTTLSWIDYELCILTDLLSNKRRLHALSIFGRLQLVLVLCHKYPYVIIYASGRRGKTR